MIGLFVKYLSVAGGTAAGTQVVRGVMRGATRLARGDGRGALAEVAGGLGSPLMAALHQIKQLGTEVHRSASSLTTDVRAKVSLTVAPSAPRIPKRRRRRTPTVAAVSTSAA